MYVMVMMTSQCFLTFANKSCSRPRHCVASIFREPHEHVRSMWRECVYSDWGKKVTAQSGFPTGSTDAHGFARWVRTFTSWDRVGKAKAFNCYAPYNVQTRYFTCKLPIRPGLPHFVWSRRKEELQPSVKAAIQNVRRLNAIGISEFYGTSLCLISYTCTGSLPGGCTCTSWENQSVTYDTRGAPMRKFNVSAETQKAVSELTRTDRALYTAVLAEFAARLRQAENQLNRRILCSHREILE